MVLKRPFSDEELSEISCKLPRQLDCSYHQMTSYVDIVPSDHVPCKQHTSSAEAEGGFTKSQSEEDLVNGNSRESAVGANKGFEGSALCNDSSPSWGSSRPSENGSKSDTAAQLSFFPGFYDPDQPLRTLVGHKEIYSSLVDFTPRRLVSVGPDHQVYIPTWDAHGLKNACNDNSSEMMGTCVIPMPDSGPSFFSGIGYGRTDCSCQDEGSLRCVKQHIVEAREKLRENLGHDRFVELGFCDMGEEVARKWSEEEEQVFHEVVFSYPVSLGKNFWNHLLDVFPSRTKKELVSYYFNVFMLRKRGVQNRMDPLNIDSDDDEWQGSEDGDDEFGTTDDEDSVIESPIDQDNPVYSEDHRGYFCEDDDEGEEEESYNDDTNTRDNERQEKVLGADTGESPGDCSSDPVHPRISEEDHDIQDDSCTSYECQPCRDNSSGPSVAAAKQECRLESDHSKHLDGSFDGLNVMGYDEYCDERVWNVEYLRGPKTDVDFLPTCNMIKEVFGDEAWNNKGRDNKSIS